MTEREFDQKVEAAAERFERFMDASADKLDQHVTHAWNNSLLFRIITRGTSMTAEIGLLIGAKHLGEKGYETAAAWCAVLGALGLAFELIRILIFRRSK